MGRRNFSHTSNGNSLYTENQSHMPVHSCVREALLLAALAILVFFIYSNTLHGPFTFDDMKSIGNNPSVRLSELTWEGISRAAYLKRPVAKISFALNYYFHQYDVLGYHLVNILIHITTGILLYLFARTTLSIPSLGSIYPANRWIPFFTAVVWLVHPIQTQSVTYIVQRMNSMAVMFYVLSLFLYAKARLGEGKVQRWLLFAGCAFSGLLALGSKEMTAILPFFIFLYEWYFFQDLSKDWLKRHLGYVLGIVGLFALISFVFLGLNPQEKLQAIGDYSRKEFTFGERVLTQPRVVIYYLSLLFYPHPSRLNLDYDFPLSHSLIDPVTALLSIGAIVGLLGLACLLAKKERLLSFCIIWFFGNLVIESSVVPLALIFEHRTYLPSMLVSLTAVTLAYRHVKVRWVTVVALCAMAGVCSVWTYERNRVWGDEVSLWSDCVQKSPLKARPHNNLGYALRTQGKVDEAIGHYTEALRIKPDYGEAHTNLGAALALQGRLEEAMSHYAEALRIDPDSVGAHSNLGSALVNLGRFDEAAGHCCEALRIDPDFAEAHSNLGSALAGLGRLEEAASHCYQALKLKPDHAEAHVNLGAVLLSQGKLEGAIDHFSEALQIKPDSVDAHYNLGLGLARQGSRQEAMGHFSKTLKLKPDHAEAHVNLGAMLASEGRLEEAIDHFSEALRIKPDFGEAKQYLEQALEDLRKPKTVSNATTGH